MVASVDAIEPLSKNESYQIILILPVLDVEFSSEQKFSFKFIHLLRFKFYSDIQELLKLRPP